VRLRFVDVNPRLKPVRDNVGSCTSIGRWVDFWGTKASELVPGLFVPTKPVAIKFHNGKIRHPRSGYIHEAPVPLRHLSGSDLHELGMNSHIDPLHRSRRCRVEWVENILDPEDVVQSVRYWRAQPIDGELHVQREVFLE